MDYIQELPCEMEPGCSHDIPMATCGLQGPPGLPGDSLGPPHRPKKRRYLNKCTAPKSLDCCVRILSLQCSTPRTPLDCFIIHTLRMELLLVNKRGAQNRRKWWTHMGGRGPPISPRGQAPLHILYIYIYEGKTLLCWDHPHWDQAEITDEFIHESVN